VVDQLRDAVQELHRVLVIVPTYNEAENLGRLSAEILAQDPRLELLVIDDGSPDGTGAIADGLAAAEPRIQVLHRAGKLGLGTAYVLGFRWALERGYDAVCQMDADFSHDPKVLRVFLQTIADCDLVIGSRYKTGVNVVNWPLSRLLLSYGASIYTRLITGMPVRDPTSGFKCFRRSTLEALDLQRLHSGGYSFQIEVNFKVWRRGLRIREVPIIFEDRLQGQSKMSRAIVREAIWMVWKLKLQSIFRRL
jgi:dolichol-phosphate mannosyltransferase